MRHRDRREERETGVRGRGREERHRPPVSQDSENHPLQSLRFLSCFLRWGRGWGSAKKAAPGAGGGGANHPALPPEEE